ncbi:hypothetical protein IMZ48_49780 [Candidatus Bathyarchaeota archaeon]|nr:hypothetical protein [Candidatus Bathyarchaeota archaeon]
MGADRPDKKKEKKEKKESKVRDEGGVKKEKKEKKEKKDKKAKLTTALEGHLEGEEAAAAVDSSAMVVDEVATPKKKAAAPALVGTVALVEFAVPLADEKNVKKSLKGVRKGKSCCSHTNLAVADTDHAPVDFTETNHTYPQLPRTTRSSAA